MIVSLRGIALTLLALAGVISLFGAVTQKYSDGFINVSVCYRGVRPSLVLGGPLRELMVVNKTWGPPYFRMTARILAWPGGQIGFLANSAAYCDGPFDADAYMKQWREAHPDAEDTTDEEVPEAPGAPT